MISVFNCTFSCAKHKSQQILVWDTFYLSDAASQGTEIMSCSLSLQEPIAEQPPTWRMSLSFSSLVIPNETLSIFSPIEESKLISTNVWNHIIELFIVLSSFQSIKSLFPSMWQIWRRMEFTSTQRMLQLLWVLSLWKATALYGADFNCGTHYYVLVLRLKKLAWFTY